MENEANTGQEESSKSLNSENETNKVSYSSIIDREKIDGTPFIRIRTDKGFALTMGTYRLTEFYPTMADINKILKQKDWDTIITLVMALIDLTKRNPDMLKME